MTRPPDPPQSVAFDDRAPPGERRDALGELHRTYAPTVGDLAKGLSSPDSMQILVDYLREQAVRQELLKAAAPVRVPFPSENAQGVRMKSVRLDDWQIGIQGEYYDRPSQLGFDTLRAMAAQPPISLIIQTRLNHVRRFARQNDSGEGPGFAIRHRDKDHKLTGTEKQNIGLLSRFIANCGWEFDPRARQRMGRTSLGDFMAVSVRDSLTLDSAPIETEMKRDARLGMDGFYAIDGATIRLCTEAGYQGHDEIFALQVIQSRIRCAYTRDDLIYQARNPVSNVASGGYGLSEVDLLVRVVTGFLNAMNLNITGFTDNAIPKGLLQIYGDFDKQDMLAFKTYWNAMVKGINQKWTLPVLAAKDKESGATYTPLNADFNEMYFSKWMTFLTAISCAIFGMSPDEINFESFSSRTGGIGNGNDTGEKLANSRDKGLIPLLRFYEDTFSDFILPTFDEKYVFRWTGLDEEDRQAKQERQKLYLTVDEMRAQDGQDKHPDPAMGAAPVNPNLIGLYVQMQQVRQQQDSQDFGEGFDEDGEGEPDEGADGGKQPPRRPVAGDEEGGEGGAQQPPGAPMGKSFGMTVYRIEA
ncbi:phage portal protein [Methylomagnum ishizawai]|uniref:phage portal protein n=1 Tax=Methylomagnum ishizawai TaxID=1760988 RepID=UPI001C3266BF|nr:phage portal protein [Methylomagnum ishizawai]BBL75438.1 hypothetical protein MishRS11D_25360 [Methylomagnum ishizawai]